MTDPASEAIARYRLARDAHVAVIASLRAIDVPEAARVIRDLSAIVHRLDVAIARESEPWEPMTWQQAYESRRDEG